MIQIRNFINGQWQEETGGKTVPLYNPSTGETIGSVPVSNMETCEAAIATAAEAYKTWRLVPIAKRMTYIHKIRECMIRDLEKLAQGIALDQAKHISEARGEVQRVIEIVEMACSIPALIQGETLDQIAGSITGKVTKQSLGVFGGVAPFNFPALVFGWFIPFAIGTATPSSISRPPSRPTSCSSCAKSSWKSACPAASSTSSTAAATSPARGMKIPASRACASSGPPRPPKKWPKAAPEAPSAPCCSAARKTCLWSWKTPTSTFSSKTTSTPATAPRASAASPGPSWPSCPNCTTPCSNA